MKYILLSLVAMPVFIGLIGLIMWIYPRKNTFKKELSFRQKFGKFIFVISAALSLVELGAMERDNWFVSEGRFYCYKVHPILASDSLPADSIKADTLVVSQDSVFTQHLSMSTPNEIVIPYTEGMGVKFINLKVGSADIKAIFDTGCGNTIDFCYKDYYKLVGAGIIEEEKFIGRCQSVIADGRTLETLMFKLPECSIGNGHFKDIKVGVTYEGETTLVGSEFFKDYLVTIDNTNKKIILKKNVVPSTNSKP